MIRDAFWSRRKREWGEGGGEARHADGQEVAGVREEEQLKTKERRRSREEKLEKRRCKGKKSVAVKNSSE